MVHTFREIAVGDVSFIEVLACCMKPRRYMRLVSFHRLIACCIASRSEHLVMNESPVTGKIRGHADPF